MDVNQAGAASRSGTDFGGLCFNGHDVPRGANFCPDCGAPTPNSRRDRAWPTEPPTYQATPPPPQGGSRGQQRYGAPWIFHRYGTPWGYGPPRPTAAPYWGPVATWNYWVSRRNRRLNPLAVVSLVLALTVFVTSWWGALAAVATGHAARVLMRKYDQRGWLYAGAGLIIGYFSLFVWALWSASAHFN